MKNFDEEKYKKASEKVKEIKAFYSNLVSYVLVNAFLIFINLTYSPEYLWFVFPLIGWGMGLLIHGFTVFGNHWIFSKEWEEKQIKKYMDKDK
ncbi:2TM domain-containing protein [Aureivirga marina]|uniref:2TM domain-containing protein n=1 Tax=Aureivirga marina TaxID=1182451 RepID=UPI0018C91405|nr:2TM domain-containing protein [Aureivirga marina]